MAKDINQVTIIGRLVRDPEIRYTSSGTPVTKFSIANNNTFIQNNERKDDVSYFDINVWGNQAVNCEKYLKKGSQVAIIGSLRQNRWNDKTTGQTRSKVEITANSVQFLSPVQGGGAPSESFSQDAVLPQEQNSNGSDNSSVIEDPWNDSPASVENDNSGNNNNDDDDIPF